MRLCVVTNNKIFKILFILSLIITVHFAFFTNILNQILFIETESKFNNIFPKININDTEIPNKTEIFNSRKLFITDAKLTKEYINFIKPNNLVRDNHLKNHIYEGIEPNLHFMENRKNKISTNEFFDLCLKEKLIYNKTFTKNDNPFISVLIIAYNMENRILKSIRSIQNQSLKNIEIIIVDDCSTDNSKEIFENLLETDKRIRIFTHLKNMGAWRSRLDAFLYSNAPYVIHFDAGDFYSDNYVLEDIYYLANKYKLDSLRFSFRLTKEKMKLSHKDKIYTFKKKDRKIVYGRRKYNVYGYRYGTIWNRLTKAEVFVKGLLYLDEYILNAYKNLYDDRWWNTLGNNESYSFLMTNRLGYIYLKDFNGEGNIKRGNAQLNEKSIKEIIYFFLFDYYLSNNKSDKKDIINGLRDYQKGKKHLKLSDLKTYFKPYEHLLYLLINDKYVSKQNKLFLLSLKHKIK